MGRYHSVRHLKGKLEVDVNRFNPNANYWKIGAKGAYNSLREFLSDDELETLIESLDGKTWREKCLFYEEKLKEKRELKKNG